MYYSGCVSVCSLVFGGRLLVFPDGTLRCFLVLNILRKRAPFLLFDFFSAQSENHNSWKAVNRFYQRALKYLTETLWAHFGTPLPVNWVDW